MAVRNWNYVFNTFEVQTRENFKKMLSLDLDHYGKLVEGAALEPLLIPLRDEYLPFHTAYQSIYASWQGAEGTHEGSTLNVEELLLQLSSEIKTWEGVVRFIFPEDSPNERSIFPNKRGPFQKGTYEQRISAVQTLYVKLATYTTQPLLVTLSTTVQSFYNSIEAARLAQTGDELGISSQSSLLEDQRKICAVGMYGNLGRLMYIMRENPTGIEQFWDMSLLRNIADNAYTETLTVNPESTSVVGLSSEEREAITASTVIFLKNTSTATVNLRAGFNTTAGPAAILPIVLVPDEERELSASELGWSSERKYFIVTNETGETGTMDVEVDI